jgi:hypothetical protein
MWRRAWYQLLPSMKTTALSATTFSSQKNPGVWFWPDTGGVKADPP